MCFHSSGFEARGLSWRVLRAAQCSAGGGRPVESVGLVGVWCCSGFFSCGSLPQLLNSSLKAGR